MNGDSVLMRPIDGTHDPQLKSWVDSANDPESDFPIQNLPFGRWVRDAGDDPRLGVAIGDQVLDLSACGEAGLLPAWAADVVRTGNLNHLMSYPVESRLELRRRLSQILATGSPDQPAVAARGLVPQSNVHLLVPCHIGDYSDFYASIDHATNVGSMFRPDQPLLPNYKHVPIGYHGRASSCVVSGSDVRRPAGQLPPPREGDPPEFGLTRGARLRIGGRGLDRTRQPAGGADPAAAGRRRLVRDRIGQRLVGPRHPTLGVSAARPVPGQVVRNHRVPLDRDAGSARPVPRPRRSRDPGDPAPLAYLDSPDDQRAGGIELQLEVTLTSHAMRRSGLPAFVVSRGSFRSMYWTFAQMVAHHTSNGCNLQPGDLLASGTVSGSERESRGCLLERTWSGPGAPATARTPLELPSGETRVFLADGDEVTLRGRCAAPGRRSIGLGECRGKVAAGSLTG